MHSHSHDDNDRSKRIGWAFFLNVGFTVIEFIGGVLTNCIAIMADAVHGLGDQGHPTKNLKILGIKSPKSPSNLYFWGIEAPGALE